MYSFLPIDFLEHLNDKLSQILQPLLRIKGNLVLVSLVEQHPTHPCPEQINPAPGPWPKEAVGHVLTASALEHGNSHSLQRTRQTCPDLWEERGEQSRRVFFLWLRTVPRHGEASRSGRIRWHRLKKQEWVYVNTSRKQINGTSHRYKCGAISHGECGQPQSIPGSKQAMRRCWGPLGYDP